MKCSRVYPGLTTLDSKMSNKVVLTIMSVGLFVSKLEEIGGKNYLRSIS